MSEQNRIDDLSFDPESAAFEESLKRLLPASPAITSAQIVAEALGRSESARRDARRQAWIWRGVAGAMAASLAIALLQWPPRAPERVVIKVVHDHPAAWTPTMATALDDDAPRASGAYLILRQRVLAEGLAALPDAASSPAVPTLRAEDGIHGDGI